MFARPPHITEDLKTSITDRVMRSAGLFWVTSGLVHLLVTVYLVGVCPYLTLFHPLLQSPTRENYFLMFISATAGHLVLDFHRVTQSPRTATFTVTYGGKHLSKVCLSGEQRALNVFIFIPIFLTKGETQRW